MANLATTSALDDLVFPTPADVQSKRPSLQEILNAIARRLPLSILVGTTYYVLVRDIEADLSESWMPAETPSGAVSIKGDPQAEQRVKPSYTLTDNEKDLVVSAVRHKGWDAYFEDGPTYPEQLVLTPLRQAT